MSDDVMKLFSSKDYEVTQKESLYEGYFQLSRYHLRHRRFDGEWSNTFSREVFERKSAAAVLPYDPVLDKIVLIEQFRTPILANAKHSYPWIIEVVAGVFDKDESPADLIKREAIEEAGCTIQQLHPICEYFVSPGGSNEYLHLFIGEIDATDAGGNYGLMEENEDIRAFAVSTDEAFVMLRDGKIKTSPAIIALQWLQINRQWLKQLWQKK